MCRSVSTNNATHPAGSMWVGVVFRLPRHRSPADGLVAQPLIKDPRARIVVLHAYTGYGDTTLTYPILRNGNQPGPQTQTAESRIGRELKDGSYAGSPGVVDTADGDGGPVLGAYGQVLRLASFDSGENLGDRLEVT